MKDMQFRIPKRGGNSKKVLENLHLTEPKSAIQVNTLKVIFIGIINENESRSWHLFKGHYDYFKEIWMVTNENSQMVNLNV